MNDEKKYSLEEIVEIMGPMGLPPNEIASIASLLIKNSEEKKDG